MLKIAKGINLEELKKYDFEYKIEENYEFWKYQEKHEMFKIILIEVQSREIINCGANDKLYDLFQAGMVIKE